MFINCSIEAQQCEEVVCAKIDEARLKKPTVNVGPVSLMLYKLQFN